MADELLKLGDHGPDVANWRVVLAEDGYHLDPPDDAFNTSVHNATVGWQKARGLKPDGIVGANTRAQAGLAAPMRAVARFDPVTIPYIEAFNWSRTTPSQPKDLIVLHSMEAPEASTTAEWCAEWFAGKKGPAPQASAHYCLTMDSRILLDNCTWRPIGDVRQGTRIWSTEEDTPGMGGRTLLPAEVTRCRERRADCVRIVMADGREVTSSRDHRWLVKPPAATGSWQWRAAGELDEGWHICAPFTPWPDGADFESGYMSGIFDGEGSWTHAGDLSFGQRNNAVLAEAKRILARHGLATSTSIRPDGLHVVVTSGLNSTMAALGRYQPRRLRVEPRIVGRALRSRLHSNQLPIEAVEAMGLCDVMSIETSTHTYFAEGMVSHNCVDDDTIICCVPPDRIAWHAPGANHNGIGIEHAGFARQTRQQWMDDFSLRMLALSAQLSAWLCRRFKIPLHFVVADHIKHGGRGITTHAEVSKAYGKSTHWDPGPNFPVGDYLRMLADANARHRG